MTLRRLFGLIVAALFITVAGTALAEGDPASGEKVYKKCKACHTLEEGGASKMGPNLFGIFGRTSGALEGFKFSDALTDAAIVWDEGTIDQYLTKPKDMVPGTKMAFPGIKDEGDRKDLIAYLKAATE
jgi:cytochrome c